MKHAGLILFVTLLLECLSTWARAAGAAPPDGQLSSTAPLSLDQVVQLALAHNPELLAASAKVDAAKGQAYQAGLWSNPELELATEEGPARGGRVFSDAKQTIGLAQTIPFPGKKRLDRQIGTRGVRAREAEWHGLRLEITREVKTAFFQVLVAERRVEVARQLTSLAESSASTARKRVDAGAAPDQEQLRAEILLEQAQAERTDFERALAGAREALAALAGRPELKRIPLAGALVESADLGLLEHGPEQWLSSHPSMVAARLHEDRTELEWRRAQLEPYPDVTLGVAGGREGGPERSSIVEFRVSVPLPLIDRGKGRQQEARANLAQAEAERRAVERRLLREWGTLSAQLRAAAAQVAAYRDRILPKADRALRLVQTGFDEGKFGFIDLLDTQRTTAEVRLVYQDKLLELSVAQAELEALRGELSLPEVQSTRP